jgi:ketosteroid isomerase-like protein
MAGTTKSVDGALKLFMDNLATPGWDTLVELLADDAVMEFPYAPPERTQKLNGKQEIVPYFDALKQTMSLDEVHLVATHKTTDPNVVILQAEGKGRALKSGCSFEPKYVVFLTFRGGLIVRWQDYWNPLTGILALGGTISFPQQEA